MKKINLVVNNAPMPFAERIMLMEQCMQKAEYEYKIACQQQDPQWATFHFGKGNAFLEVVQQLLNNAKI